MASLSVDDGPSSSVPGDTIARDIDTPERNSVSLGRHGEERNVESVLRDTTTEGDMMWSLFVSAAKSYRFSSILHPFPPMYSEENETEKQIYALRESISQMPRLSSKAECPSELSTECYQLLSWVFDKPRFQLKLRDRDTCFLLIRDLTSQVQDAPVPSFVFEVVHDGLEESRFAARRGNRKNFYGYHGSRLDNFYSILHNGLNGHFNKTAVFGEGTYLSSELSVSLLYSQTGEAWSKSRLGPRLACVAVCEMIDDPSVKCQVKEGSADVQQQRAQASKMTDAVPEKYYVVQNNDAVRVKYLLVYQDQSSQSRTAENSPSISWIQQYKFPLMMLAYVILLLAIGLASSKNCLRIVKTFFSRLGNS